MFTCHVGNNYLATVVWRNVSAGMVSNSNENASYSFRVNVVSVFIVVQSFT